MENKRASEREWQRKIIREKAAGRKELTGKKRVVR